MLRTVAGRPGWRRLLVSYLLGGEPAMPGQQRRGRHRKDPGPAPPRDEPHERGVPGPVAWLVPHPASVSGAAPRSRAGAPAARRPSPGPRGTSGRSGQRPAHQQVGDLEQHPASQPSPRQTRSRTAGQTTRSSIRAAQDPGDPFKHRLVFVDANDVVALPCGRNAQRPGGHCSSAGPSITRMPSWSAISPSTSCTATVSASGMISLSVCPPATRSVTSTNSWV